MTHLLTIIGCDGKSLEIANCTRWRADGCVARCTKYGTIRPGQCAACKIRRPVMGKPAEPMRGLGDLVARIIRILFLGRLDIAERLAGRVEALWSRRRPDVSVSLPTTPRRPCGCKGRQQRLNDLLPFGK
jgi:hypothetical protein